MATEIAGNRDKQKLDTVWSFPETIPSRRNQVCANHVEIGIAMQGIHGTDQAAEYLKAQGITIDVAIRVLAHRGQRRKVIESK